MKKIRIDLIVLVVTTFLFIKSGYVIGTEDEYEDDHGDNVVEHPGPTFAPTETEVEEKVTSAYENVPFIQSLDVDSSNSNEEEEDIIQTTTYPVFDNDEQFSSTSTSTSTESAISPPTSTTTETSSTTSTTTPTTTTSTSTEGSTSSTVPTTSTTNPSTSTEEGILSSTTTTSEATNVPFLPPHQRPVRSDLASMPLPKGQEILVGNLTIYESPVTNETFDGVMLISVHDIFGFHPHVKYISDRLSEYGFRAVVPDFFHGNPVPVENFPPPNFTETARYLFNKDGFWKPVKNDLLNAMNYYRQVANVTSFGMYGFCWGGKMIMYASADSDFTGINAIGLVHPSRVVNQDANEINAPAILLPSNAEPDMIPFLKILQKRFGEGKSEHYRYDDMRHGFAGATGDFSNVNVRARVEDAIEKLGNYFRKHLV